MKEAMYYRVALLLSSVILIILCLGITAFWTEASRPVPIASDERESGPAARPGKSSPRRVDAVAGPQVSTPAYERFVATAYSINGRTYSGVRTNTGIVAADPQVLPIGSIIEVQAGKYSGLYSVMDTGSSIKGKRIDIYIPNSREARLFGKRRIKLRVIRHGWTPSLSDQARLTGAAG